MEKKFRRRKCARPPTTGEKMVHSCHVQRRCRLCHNTGHNSRTCPLLTKKTLSQSQHQNKAKRGSTMVTKDARTTSPQESASADEHVPSQPVVPPPEDQHVTKKLKIASPEQRALQPECFPAEFSPEDQQFRQLQSPTSDVFSRDSFSYRIHPYVRTNVFFDDF